MVIGLKAPSLLEGVNSDLKQVSKATSKSIARLSSGERIVNSSDDVAAISIATKLRFETTALRNALLNNSQAASLLQVADSGFESIQTILQRMEAISVQAGSGSLSDADRVFLDQEFQNLSEEIDRLVESTTFNGIQVLKSTLEDKLVGIDTETAQADRAYADLLFTAPITAGQTVVINNVTFTAGTDFNAGDPITSIASLAQALNSSNNPLIAQASYEAVHDTLRITHRAGGDLGTQFTIQEGTSTATFTTVGGATPSANIFSLTGGADNGLRLGSVDVIGTAGDLVTDQNQIASFSTLEVTTGINNNEIIFWDDGNFGVVQFRFTNAPALATDVQLGATTQESLQNAIAVMSQYSAADDFGIRAIEFLRDGDNLTFRSQIPGNVVDAINTNHLFAESMVNGNFNPNSFLFGVFSIGFMDNGSNTGGVNTSGIVNSDFFGQISGFSAAHTGADQVNASLTVGSDTYSATISDTNPTTNSVVTFTSEDGGYFSLELDAFHGLEVNSQSDADAYAALLDEAFSELTFLQTRTLNLNPSNGPLLSDITFELQSDSFSDLEFEEAVVTSAASNGSNTGGLIELTINGETYRNTAQVGQSIGAFEVFELTSDLNGNNKIILRNGATTIDLSTDGVAEALQAELNTAFATDFASVEVPISFQIGSDSEDQFHYTTAGASTDVLFGEAAIHIRTKEAAEDAAGRVLTAIDMVTSARANVGSLQSRTAFNAANLEQAIRNQDAARAGLEDTNLASESTQFALGIVKQQSSIAMIAQTNSLRTDIMNDIYNFEAIA